MLSAIYTVQASPKTSPAQEYTGVGKAGDQTQESCFSPSVITFFSISQSPRNLGNGSTVPAGCRSCKKVVESSSGLQWIPQRPLESTALMARRPRTPTRRALNTLFAAPCLEKPSHSPSHPKEPRIARLPSRLERSPGDRKASFTAPRGESKNHFSKEVLTGFQQCCQKVRGCPGERERKVKKATFNGLFVSAWIPQPVCSWLPPDSPVINLVAGFLLILLLAIQEA